MRPTGISRAVSLVIAAAFAQRTPRLLANVAAMLVPIVETDRLRLRGHRPEDFDACVAMWADERVVRYTIGTASTPQHTWRRMLAYAGMWAYLGYGYWAIEERATGAFVGELGFADFRRDAALVPAGEPECGWALAPAMHGRGYGSEAVRAALAWADAHLDAARTVCAIVPANDRSVRLASAIGYRPLAEWHGDGATHAFERLRRPI